MSGPQSWFWEKPIGSAVLLPSRNETLERYYPTNESLESVVWECAQKFFQDIQLLAEVTRRHA